MDMKISLLLMSIVFVLNVSTAQNNTSQKNDTTNKNAHIIYKIIKTDGGELIGNILEQNTREILFKTSDDRTFYIPQHNIKEIVKLDLSEFNKKGEFVGENPFATRYYFSTNGLPLKKGESYILLNWFGPDIQFGLGNNVGVGVISTWVGAPIIGTVKKSWEINRYTNVAVGGLLGTGSWGAFDLVGGIPFASVSFGDRKSNVSISTGYGALSYNAYDIVVDESGYIENGSNRRVLNQAAMFSVAAMYKFTKKVSFVFESFFIFPNTYEQESLPDYDYSAEPSKVMGLITPGFRFQQEKGKAFQIGFAGVFDKTNIFSIPMVQWFRSF
jgi:hypothetical protein